MRETRLPLDVGFGYGILRTEHPDVTTRLTMTRNERQCYNRMLEWERRFNEVLAMYDKEKPYPVIPAQHVPKARVLYAKLKVDINEEHRQVSTHRRGDRTEAEDQWYSRTLRQASASLRAPANSRPENWHSSLFDSRNEFMIDLARMRDHFGLTENA
jgi:hypothetical protein